ncbi:hypothetical protein [Rhodoferax bucti]|uniref:hypothetical protein n=1 Tax=Rhodoferax bucti TaxID=2576305 RepID=UPI0011098D57|nr:hypothetical protein [Rhodoferax bucti]
MKITFLDIERAYKRAVYGESVRSIAIGMGVTEGALRYHFSKGLQPKELRGLAFELFHAEQLLENLDEAERRQCKALAAKKVQPKALRQPQAK